MAEVRFTLGFSRRLKRLQKRYRQIQLDLQLIIRELEQGNFIGDQIPETTFTALKVGAKNSDIPTDET